MSLSKKEIEEFRLQLIALKRQLHISFDAVALDVKTADPSKAAAQHHADGGTDDFDRTINIEVTSKGFDVMRQVDRALEKIADNSYGICDITGDEIPKKRLEAIPYASMTRDAQEKIEKGLLY